MPQHLECRVKNTGQMYIFSASTTGRCLVALLAIHSWVWTADTSFAQSGPVVANVELKLTLKDEVIDVIEKGDLLTVLKVRENSYVIQTFNGKKGAVSKANAVVLSEAVGIYDELIDDNPDVGRLYTLRASAHLAANNPDKALEDYSMAIERGYEEAHAYTSRGMFYAATGKFEEAIADYSVAIEKDPEDELGFINRAGAFMSTGSFDKAIADYTAAAKLQPENPVLYSQRAIAHKMLGKLELAVEDYNKTIELAEKDVSAWMGRGFVYFQLAKYEKAIEDFSQAIELSPASAVAFNNRGFNYQQLGKLQEAHADYKQAIELAPRYLLALQNFAWLITSGDDEDLRDPDKAIEIAMLVCEQSEFKDPSDLTLLAAAHASGFDYKAAIGWQEKVIKLVEGEQKRVAEAILKLYQNNEPFDPTLLETDQTEEESESRSDGDAAPDKQ